MKKFVSLWSIVAVIFFLNCSDGATEKSNLVADSEMELSVDGMVCAVGCAKFIEKEVSGLAGVLDCNVDFESGKAHINYVGSEIDKTEILSAITNLNDGQYKVEVVDQKSIKSKENSQQGSVRKAKANGAKVSFYFPELITYFMHRIVQ